MNTRIRPVLVGVATVVAALLLLAGPSYLAGCGGGDEDVDPQVVLAACSAKMKEIKGFHFEYEVHLPQGEEPGGGLFIRRIVGEVNSEGNMQATVDAIWSGVPVSLGFVALGDTHYIQNPLSQQWEEIPAAESPVGTLSLSAGTIQILDRITETSFAGRESKGGVETHHIVGTVAAAEVEAIAGAVDTTNPFPTDVWIGIDDSLLYEVDIAGAATPNEHEDIWRSIILSDLDVYVEIEAPQ